MAASMRLFSGLKIQGKIHNNLKWMTLFLNSANVITRVPSVTYAKKVGGGKGMKGIGMVAPLEKRELEVEEDPEKLVNYCCGANIYKDGQDPKLKPDSEYPDWLWELRLDRKPVPLEELDTDTWDYWRRLRKQQLVRNARLAKVNRFK